ncbi:hypothetical protein S40288_01790 [Stachybotrys chartarum IBT 40288]|nr:hypothetical protein S40288_01790 [Stachybotrys chartarum IBT 40288]
MLGDAARPCVLREQCPMSRVVARPDATTAQEPAALKLRAGPAPSLLPRGKWALRNPNQIAHGMPATISRHQTVPPPPSAKIRQSCRIFARDLRLYVIPSPTSNDAEQPSSATVDGAVLSWLVLALPCWQSLLVDDPCRRPTSTEQGPANPLEIPRFESHLAKDWSPSRVRRSPSRHQSRWSLVSLQHARPYADSMSPLPAGLH